MKISSKSWKSYVDRLSKIDQIAAGKVSEWYRNHPDADIEELINVTCYYCDHYGDAAGALACEMYDEIAMASGKMVPPAEPTKTATYGEVASALQGALLRTKDPDAIGAVAGRKVKTVGLDTLLNNSLRDGAEFAWIPSGDTCAFCIMLASNGWQKASKRALKNGHAEHVHSNCDCTYAIRFDENTEVEGYDPDYYKSLYDSAEGDIWRDKVNSMRRDHYAANKDKINAQKRAAYSLREQHRIIDTAKDSGLKLLEYEQDSGIINIEIDEIVPCLRDLKTGELVETTIGVVTDRNLLKSFTKSNGWYIDWYRVPTDNTILALRVKGSDVIQGLVAFKGNRDNMTVVGHWIVANPMNNKLLTSSPRYSGVGGHLFAAMAEASRQMGYEGYIEGKAANSKLLKHYIEKLGAKPLGNLRFYIDDVAAERLIKEYTWENV